jgi:hypothetical protein
MGGIRKLALARPPTRKVVWEVGVSNVFGRWMRRRGWAGFTLPLPGVVLVFYWLLVGDERPDPFVRVHEFVHVRQDQRFFLFPVRYLVALLTDGGYGGNRFEIEASQIEAAARREGLPAWAEL